MWISSLLKVGNYSLDNKDHVNPFEKKTADNVHFNFNITQVINTYSHKPQALQMWTDQPSLAKYLLLGKLTEIQIYA